MLSNCDNKCLYLIILSVACFAQIYAQHSFVDIPKSDNLIWCTTSEAEQYKCTNFSVALERDRGLFLNDSVTFYNISCHHGFDTEECIQLINNEKASIMSLDAGDVFNAGRYHSLIPFMQEKYDGGFNYMYAVAVIKKGSLPDVHNIQHLRGKKACFAGVGTLAGWITPLYTLLKQGNMEVVDCNNVVKNAANFFGKSCAVNSLLNKNNPIGDNSYQLCDLCAGPIPGKCTAIDPYAGYEGAFRCLLEAGEVAFLKHNTVSDMLASNEFKSVGADTFELLCSNGQRMSTIEYRNCNWGVVPSNALVISSAKTAIDRKSMQKFFLNVMDRYSYKDLSSRNNSTTDLNRTPNSNPFDYNRGGYQPYQPTTTTDRNFGFNNRFDNLNRNGFENNNTLENGTQLYEKFDIFESQRYGGKLNLLFQDTAEGLMSIKEIDQNFGNYLGDARTMLTDIRECPVGRMIMCVTSDAEMEKCNKMKIALKAQLIKPEMICHKGHSHINCMQSIRGGVADVTVLDASDVYTAGLNYDLIPFLSEVYTLGKPEYYVVAVAKEQDPSTEITYLKGKRTCHSGMNTAAGWVYPMAYLISNGWIRPYGCDSVRAAAEYFSKSCIPGALSNEYNTGVPYDNLCHLCHGSSFRYCRRDASEDYYGHSGALQCLVEGGGDVAFIKHTAVTENAGGLRKEWWARNTLTFDFELLCPDGTRGYLKDFAKCNLGKVKANAIVTRGGSEVEINAFINLFTYAQQHYGRKDPDDFSFSMFYSPSPYHDLIFQDATRQLSIIPPAQRRYDLYLGKDFMRARRITDCYAGSSQIKFGILTFVLPTFTLMIIFRRNL